MGNLGNVGAGLEFGTPEDVPSLPGHVQGKMMQVYSSGVVFRGHLKLLNSEKL